MCLGLRTRGYEQKGTRETMCGDPRSFPLVALRKVFPTPWDVAVNWNEKASAHNRLAIIKTYYFKLRCCTQFAPCIIRTTSQLLPALLLWDDGNIF